MGRWLMIGVAVMLMVTVAPRSAARAEGPMPVGTVVGVSGTVEVGRDGVWQPAVAKMHIFDGQVLRAALPTPNPLRAGGRRRARTGSLSPSAAQARIEGQGEDPAPTDASKAEMQVTR
jgi:hypothetical protein